MKRIFLILFCINLFAQHTKLPMNISEVISLENPTYTVPTGYILQTLPLGIEEDPFDGTTQPGTVGVNDGVSGGWWSLEKIILTEGHKISSSLSAGALLYDLGSLKANVKAFKVLWYDESYTIPEDTVAEIYSVYSAGINGNPDESTFRKANETEDKALIEGMVLSEGTSIKSWGVISIIEYDKNYSNNEIGVLSFVTEAGNVGVRLSSANADLYGDIGNNALDLTFSNTGTDVSSGATGDSSVALGENTTASGTFSTAIGVGSQATGQGSIALGSGNIASGNYSTVSGFENVASGTMSVALGDKNQSSGWGSAAFGQETTASGNYSFTAGINTTASVGGAVAMGTNSVASGAESVAIGLNPTASGDVSIALGNGVVSSGDNSFASGIGTNAIGNFSTAMGINSFANGQGSTAMGSATKANGLDSTAMGWNNQANGGASTAMGGGTIASDYASLAIGYFNDSGSTITGSSTVFDNSNTAFIIGNGADNDNRSDALVVKFDGTTTIAGDLNINSDARLKANIISLGSTLAKLLQIDGKTYTMKKDENGKQKIGLLAQDIEKVFPDLVSESNGIKSVNYQGLVPVLINALKEQDVLIKEQQRILSEQQSEVHELKSMMQKIIERL